VNKETQLFQSFVDWINHESSTEASPKDTPEKNIRFAKEIKVGYQNKVA
jgi:hypothetical protein